MPRPNPGRTTAAESHLAARVAFERRKRGVGVDALAKLMTDAGCRISGSAILRIEKGEPRRRVTVDELLALATVFEADPMDLLRPRELVERDWAEAVAQELATARADLESSHAAVVRAVTRLAGVAGESAELAEFVENQFRHLASSSLQWFAEFDALDGATVSRLAELTEQYWETALGLAEDLIEEGAS